MLPSFNASEGGGFKVSMSNVLWVLFLAHWRLPHFYFVHRLLHPWRTSRLPDVGAWLYRHVHSLHHKSPNPTALSGTSMHPLESFLYYSAALIPVAVGRHPALFLACIVDCGVGAWLGHDGFAFPGEADGFHQLHHAHFECNYGSGHIPMDYLFGTYVGSHEEFKSHIKKKKK